MIGDSQFLGFELGWPDAAPAELAGLGFGHLVGWVGGRKHWVGEDEGPVAWTWVDLLEHLARAWAHLRFEEVAPFGLVAAGPEGLRELRLLKSVRHHDVIEVEDAVHRYQHRHDLAAGLRGLSLAPLWILREGSTLRVRADGRDVRRPLAEGLRVLEALGGELAEHLGQSQHPRAVEAVRRWSQRGVSLERVLELRTGLDRPSLERLVPPGEGLDWWGARPHDQDSPLMAAARLSGPLEEETRAQLLRALAQVPKVDTPALDALTRVATQVKAALADDRPFEQGYRMALWLRRALVIGDAPLDPHALLVGWGVHVGDLPAVEPALDAVACWGPAQGPAVLVNPAGRFSSSTAGRRATLSHEIAHLLLDRDDELPAAEVFGGSVPLHIEQRARAFAAELLLPREAASRGIAAHATLDEAAEALRQAHGVSQEVLAWQIRNGSGWTLLDARSRRQVSRWCRSWR